MLRILQHALDRWLDVGLFGGPWQRFKWALKYRLGFKSHVPSLLTLAARPHRPLLLETIDALGPWRSALEVGCGRGANLLLLGKCNPEAALLGMDISVLAIEQARREFGQHVVNIRFSVGSAEDLSAYADDSVDVVFADAVTMYLPPASIRNALREMCRVARLGVVIGTWHAGIAPSSSPWMYDEGAWVYDYHRLLLDLPRYKAVISPYPSGVWHDARWCSYGCIISIYPDGGGNDNGYVGALKSPVNGFLP